MEQLLCEPEDRLGSQASSSVSRPNSMIVQARRSGFITPQGMGSVDGAHLIKVASASRCRSDVITDVSFRLIRGPAESTGRTSTGILLHTVLSCATQRTPATLTTTSPLR